MSLMSFSMHSSPKTFLEVSCTFAVRKPQHETHEFSGMKINREVPASLVRRSLYLSSPSFWMTDFSTSGAEIEK